MAHYNNPNGLLASLASIKEDFPIDIVIIDDGSAHKFDEKQVRKTYTNGALHFIYHETNQGVGEAANKGLVLAETNQYEYIGRFDCGDICYIGKYKRQLEYLDKNKEVKLLSTWARVVDMEGNFLYNFEFPVTYEEIKKKIYINSMFLNPSAVFRTEVLKTVGHYDYRFRQASQDYAFFFKIVEHFKCENLPEVWLDYVIDPNSISSSKRRVQIKNRLKIITEHFYFGYYPIVGLVRGTISYLFPRKTLTKIKELAHKNTKHKTSNTLGN